MAYKKQENVKVDMKCLFASNTDFNSGKLTGAHRRFLELLQYVADKGSVCFVGKYNAQIHQMDKVTLYPTEQIHMIKLPKHIESGWALYKALRKYRQEIEYDYAISFNPVVSICYRMAGIKHIVSLFREDLIGYQKAVCASTLKTAYFQLQERLAVKFSEKIIVQCANDRKALLKRNERYCKKLSDKVFIQINNANASWMDTDCLNRANDNDEPTMLFIGNFSDRRKGHFLLLPVVMRLIDEGYKFKLLCAGDGKELEDWKQRCGQYPAIVFLGQVNNMKQYLCIADMLIVPSLIDSCPNTVLEGLNVGLVVYGANTGGIPDLLQDKKYLFETDEQSLYVFLKDILDSERYKADAVQQRERKNSLCFNWGEEIVKIVKS